MASPHKFDLFAFNSSISVRKKIAWGNSISAKLSPKQLVQDEANWKIYFIQFCQLIAILGVLVELYRSQSFVKANDL